MPFLLGIGHLSQHMLDLGCTISSRTIKREGYRIYFRETPKLYDSEGLIEFSSEKRQKQACDLR